MAAAQGAAKELADSLRSKGGIEEHSAIAESLRVQYFRGEDFVTYVQEHPGLFNVFSKGKPPAEAAKEVCELLLRRGLLRRCDHLYKKPPPGRKLAKYPRKLVFFQGPEAQVFGEESFYAWTYDKPTSPWVYVGAGGAVVVSLLLSLFPLAPNWVKVGVLYVSAGLLLAIVALIVARGLLAAGSWVLTGKTVWVLPNILSEVPLSELLKPAISVEAGEPGSWGSHPLTRLGVGAALAGVLYVLYTHAPDKGTVATEASRYRDEIFEFLNVHREGYQKIAGDVAVANDTAEGAAQANATGAASEAAAAGAAGAGPAAEAAAEGAGGFERDHAAFDEGPAAGQEL